MLWARWASRRGRGSHRTVDNDIDAGSICPPFPLQAVQALKYSCTENDPAVIQGNITGALAEDDDASDNCDDKVPFLPLPPFRFTI